ncbi:MAG: hypothetical protein J3Q66DRAFT_355502 [Benniella sp.]|nr:MAG: hypothetical protein J3Q66DRAFT_355502 [Benniella sp.]
MSIRRWKDQLQENREAIGSWKQLLQDFDERTIAQARKSSTSAVVCGRDDQIMPGRETLVKIHECPQVIAFSPRPVLGDLVPQSRNDAFGPPAEPISSEAIAKLKQKRRRTKCFDRTYSTFLSVDAAERWNSDNQTQDECTLGPQSISDTNTVSKRDDGKEIVGLELAIASLKSKLEILQPEGMRPSDVAAAITQTTAPNVVNATGSGLQKEECPDGDVLLSQTSTSQRSILLWDEIGAVIEAMDSSNSRTQSLAKNAVIELGLDNLDDNVLHRLCINEIFAQDQEGMTEPAIEAYAQDEGVTVERTKSPQLSYQFCIRLYSVLLCQKAIQLKSIPSRLFLDAVLNAGKAHGRAIVESTLMPVIRDCNSFSKLSSELILKTMKEQAPTTVTHFLSRFFDATSEQPSSDVGEQSILYQLPAVFLSEIHIATVQAILGYANVPCPLPTRLWNRFNAILEQLWEKVATLATSTTIPPFSSYSTLKEASETGNGLAWILKLYCPPSVWESLTKDNSRTEAATAMGGGDGGKEPFRFSNPKLVQLIMTWTIRQGAVCPDVESLQRLRGFCASRLDARAGKGIVSKLDVLINKHQ